MNFILLVLSMRSNKQKYPTRILEKRRRRNMKVKRDLPLTQHGHESKTRTERERETIPYGKLLIDIG
jgi:hypothetical protein